MNTKLVELAERRATLVARAAAQRAELSQRLVPWRGALAVVDQGVAAVRYFKSHPELLAAMVTVAVVIRPRRVLGLFRRGWVLWHTVSNVRRRFTGA
jgi:hypothetical protein